MKPTTAHKYTKILYCKHVGGLYVCNTRYCYTFMRICWFHCHI